MYLIVYSKKAIKDIQFLKSSQLAEKAKALILILENDPFQTPPSFEKFQGDLKGAYFRRINLQHRMIYEIVESTKTVKILSLWSHYYSIIA